MPRFALYDTTTFLRYIGQGDTARAVFLEAVSVVGINPNGEPIDTIAKQFYAYEIVEDKEAALFSSWHDFHGPSIEV